MTALRRSRPITNKRKTMEKLPTTRVLSNETKTSDGDKAAVRRRLSVVDLQEEISALNFLLLEQQDTIRSIANERDQYKFDAELYKRLWEESKNLPGQITI